MAAARFSTLPWFRKLVRGKTTQRRVSLTKPPGTCASPACVIVVKRRVFKVCPAVGDTAARLDRSAGVAHARGGSHDDGRVVLLGELEGVLDHAVCLAGACRVEDGDFGELREVTRILLGLTRDGAGIVSDDDDEPAFHADVRERHERIARDVEAETCLHGDESAGAGVCRAGGSLEGRFLVGGPFDVDGAVVVLGDRLEDLGRGGAGIAAHEVDARVDGAEPQRLVAHEQFDWHVRPLVFCPVQSVTSRSACA